MVMGELGSMPVFETYASRAADAAKAGSSDVYTYDKLPPFLREQISQILTACIGPGWKVSSDQFGSSPPNANKDWEAIAAVMRREVGSFVGSILPFDRRYAYGQCINYIKFGGDLDGILSLVEICGLMMIRLTESDPWGHRRADRGATADPADGLVELNERFLRGGVGYQFENGQIVRVDSQYVHAEVVKEALRLLCEPEFEKANAEFLTAHRHLREGNLRDCNTAALRSMETVLKAICDARGWTRQTGDTVERLLAIVCGEGLFPDYLGGYFTNLIGAMKAGVPKVRDRQGGHGAAPGDDPVPDHIGAFALHLTAANIVLLVKAHQALLLASPIGSPPVKSGKSSGNLY
jgi:hypothetical protein